MRGTYMSPSHEGRDHWRSCHPNRGGKIAAKPRIPKGNCLDRDILSNHFEVEVGTVLNKASAKLPRNGAFARKSPGKVHISNGPCPVTNGKANTRMATEVPRILKNP